MTIPDMKDDEAVARWLLVYMYPNTGDGFALHEDDRRAAVAIRSLCREVARKVAERTYKAGYYDGESDERIGVEEDMDHEVNFALSAVLGPERKEG